MISSSGLEAEGYDSTEVVRLVGRDGRCAGRLEVKHQGEWRQVGDQSPDWTLRNAAVVCKQLYCGSAVSVGISQKFKRSTPLWRINFDCVRSGSALTDCVSSSYSPVHYFAPSVTCSDSVRLVNGTSLCSGRLEVKTHQSNQWWSSVCEADFDLQDAEVVCRELGCGAPSVLQGALYGEVEAPMWTKEFQCGGQESALLDCRSSGSARTTCSPGKAVGLTCSGPDVEFKLEGGNHRCGGQLKMKYRREWRAVSVWEYWSEWTLQSAAVFCRELDCGSAVSTEGRDGGFPYKSVWLISPDCAQSEPLSECLTHHHSLYSLWITCSDSVRLVNGTSLCSGRLEVKTHQSNQWWSSVCEADFDLQDAEVVCRELGCGAPSVLQGALYGEVEAPMWTKEFQCGGQESALLDCRSSGSARTTCSPGKAVGLTCSEPVRLVGGASRCAGTLQVKHERDWTPVDAYDFTPEEEAVACRDLDCGSPVFMEKIDHSGSAMQITQPSCVRSGSALRECVAYRTYSTSIMNLTCSDPAASTYPSDQSDPADPALFIRLGILLPALLVLITAICCIYKLSRGQRSAPEESVELDYYDEVGPPAGGWMAEEGGVQELYLSAE
ncbi:CD5 antigen-like [Lates calcarifer]|uniref:CD5 antigen-like n=1 Tax=Lates calcarifer TaxID=8187 RepID=A0AAJ7VAV2_LATCA|nr:CD5 antigen-like [Lates calcarifer]